MMYALLDKINSPADIKDLSITQLQQLCAEIRAFMIECCASNPGHLASSLGAVELIVGLHYVFDTPNDKIVFDVGHQAYAHKILCERRAAFHTLRTSGGISGFPNRKESIYDSFGVGHSSTSISAAFGLAEAALLSGRKEKVIALIGDGAISGGLAFEGLNNAGSVDTDLLVILNDNNQSISNSLGAIHNSLLKISTNSSYNKFKVHIWKTLGNGKFRNFIQRWVRSLKSWFVKKSGGDFFEALGFRYFGPIDGNNISEVIWSLKKLKNISGPKLLHGITLKGKGYPWAEADPVTWHSPGKFDPQTGIRCPSSREHDLYQDVFGEVLCKLAESDTKVVGVTPAMALGSGMICFAEKYPDRFFDVGIEEEHAVTFSAGLAAGGIKVFCNIYSSFSQRAYDQIIHDVALQELPVVLCLDRAGLVGEDGATHHGAFDLASLRCIPNTIISSPKDELELKQLLYTAYKHDNGPFVIRYPRGMGEGTKWREEQFAELTIGQAECLIEGTDVAVIGIGPLVNRAMEAAREWPGKVGVYNFRFLKPLDEKILLEIASQYKHILTVEDGVLKGGLFGAVSEFISGIGREITIEALGIPDIFVAQGKQSEERSMCEIDKEGIRKRLKNYLENGN